MSDRENLVEPKAALGRFLRPWRRAHAPLALCCVSDEKPKYLSQAVRWAESIRWFGGSLAQAPLYVGLVEDCPPAYRQEFARLSVELVPVVRQSKSHGPSNKLGILTRPELRGYATVVLTDCDVVFAADPALAIPRRGVAAKPADLATLGDETLVPLFHRAGVDLPASRMVTTIDRREMTPYCNSGVVVLNQDVRDRFVRRWLHWNEFVLANTDILGTMSFFTDQASFALAIAEFQKDFSELAVEINFPCHLSSTRYPPGLREVEPSVLHYHHRVDGRTGALERTGLPGTDRVIDRYNKRLSEERRAHFFNAAFWDNRYIQAPELGSGIGSRGEHAQNKARIVSNFCTETAPESVGDFGCGDCSLLDLIELPGYIGVDTSRQVISRNIERFPSARFVCGQLEAVDISVDASICFDVLIHQPTRSSFDQVLDSILRCTRRGGLINGFDKDPELRSDIVFFHYPLQEALLRRGMKLAPVGEYRDTTIYRWYR